MDQLRVRPGTDLRLADIDTRATPGHDGSKHDGKQLLRARRERLAELQDLLHAEGTHALLIVLQAMDTGGKDGTIRHVFREVDPIGVHVRPFGVPSENERAHDYLWRAHAKVPATGEIVIFNRSHYEDVLVTRVHGMVDDDLAHRRFGHIRDFERMLTDEGTTVLKFFLHISRDEQAERLQARLDEPDKRWKFSSGDVAERARWHDYQRVYEEAIAATSTDWAPWYVIPADRKWYRNLAVCTTLVDVLEGLGMRYPVRDDLPADLEVE